MRVDTPAGVWVVPPARAVWIPAGFDHALHARGRVRLRTLYFRPDLVGGTTECCVLNVTPLLREMVLETLRRGMLRDDVPEEARFAAVLVDLLVLRPAASLEIRFPADPRARRVAKRVRSDLAASTPLARLVVGSGASARTIERLFLEETGQTFGRWRQRAKVLGALERLAAGDSVTAAGFAVGYESTSAFIALFRRVMGTTPGSYVNAGMRTE